MFQRWLPSPAKNQVGRPNNHRPRAINAIALSVCSSNRWVNHANLALERRGKLAKATNIVLKKCWVGSVDQWPRAGTTQSILGDKDRKHLLISWATSYICSMYILLKCSLWDTRWTRANFWASQECCCKRAQSRCRDNNNASS